jgi:hypothetical protein
VNPKRRSRWLRHRPGFAAHALAAATRRAHRAEDNGGIDYVSDVDVDHLDGHDTESDGHDSDSDGDDDNAHGDGDASTSLTTSQLQFAFHGVDAARVSFAALKKMDAVALERIGVLPYSLARRVELAIARYAHTLHDD